MTVGGAWNGLGVVIRLTGQGRDRNGEESDGGG